MATTTFEVTGLSCHRCTDTVSERLSALDGVSSVSVELVTGGVSTVTVEGREVSNSEAQDALSEGGAFSIR